MALASLKLPAQRPLRCLENLGGKCARAIRETGMKLIWILQFRVSDRKILQLLVWRDPC